ncbi:DUF2871 family protein [Fusibacter sp. JL298sf-3]
MIKKLYYSAFFYTLVGLTSGVFYRAFTKIHAFTEKTPLSYLHVHALVLGTVVFLIALILDKQFNMSSLKGVRFWFYLYHIALLGLLGTLAARGVLTVTGGTFNGLSHIAGLFHALLGGALIYWLILLGKKIRISQ